jgi:hypothetical protein
MIVLQMHSGSGFSQREHERVATNVGVPVIGRRVLAQESVGPSRALSVRVPEILTPSIPEILPTLT